MPFEEPITLTGELSISDARQGFRLTSATFAGDLVRAVVILGALACLWALWQFVMCTDADDLTLSDGILTALSFAFPSFLLFRYALVREYWRRLWEKKHFYFRPSVTVLQATGVSINSESYRAEYAWEYFTEFRRTDRVVALFGPGGTMFFGRSRFASDHDWEKFIN